MIVKEATITEFDACNNANHYSGCYSTWPRGTDFPRVKQNPNIALLMVSRTLNTSFHRVSPENKIRLRFCHENCAGHELEEAGPHMFAAVSSITFKETMHVEDYNEARFHSEWTWDEYKSHRRTEFVLDYVGLGYELVLNDVECTAHATSPDADSMDLMWTMTIT